MVWLPETFGLAIGLRVKGCRHPGADAGETEEFLPSFQGKAGVSVGDNIHRETMIPPDLAGENNGKVACRLALFWEREEVRHFGEPVDDYPELVASVGEWQVRDEVYGDGLPWGVRALEWREWPVGVMPSCHVVLALGAAPDVVYNSLVHLGPTKVSSEEFDRLILTPMAGDLGVVFRLENRIDEVLVLRDREYTLLIVWPVLDLEDIFPYLSTVLRYLTSAPAASSAYRYTGSASPAFLTRTTKSPVHIRVG
jgi:hypothetical protein